MNFELRLNKKILGLLTGAYLFIIKECLLLQMVLYLLIPHCFKLVNIHYLF